MFISIFPLFFMIRQVHTQPEITTSSSTTRAPVADAVVYNIIMEGTVFAVGACVSEVGESVGNSEDIDDGHTVTCTVVVV
jgi:hypothetical protein